MLTSHNGSIGGRRSWRRLCAAGIGLVLATATAAAIVTAQDEPHQEPSIDQTIRNDQPPFYVTADVNRPSREYREGDTLSIKVACEVDAYIYVEYQQADGKVFQIFPNSIQPNNRVAARQTVEVPGDDDLFRWAVGAPFGKEIVKVIASRQPLERLSKAEHRSKRFNPISSQDLKGIELELGEEPPAQWAEVDVEVTTYPRDHQLAATGAKRYGVFFGVSEFELNAEEQEASGGEGGLNLTVCHRDAQTLGRMMLDVGRLSDAKIYTNADATRANFESAVTQWLPSVSRPGDTVFIFFSSHCGQIDDDNGDEADGKDEFILPHDFVGSGAMTVLMKRYENGELPPAQRARVEQLVAKIRASDRDPGETLCRETGITDDLFARWIQRLSGRQVVLILDTCHSGGFDAQAKSFSPAEPPAKFDFLDKEFERLKDLGQKDQALWAACTQSEVSYERAQKDLGVFTYYLVDALNQAKGPVRIEDGQTLCEQGMEGYFAERNRQRQEAGQGPLAPHHPYLMNQCTEAVLLKP